MSELQEKRIRSLQAQVLELKDRMERMVRDAWFAGLDASGDGTTCQDYVSRLKSEGKL